MENRSRVERYREHRKKIENMDVYSFADSPTLKRNLPEHGDLYSVDRKKDGITRNTLNMSIDQLIREHDDYAEEQRKKDIQRRYQEEQKRRRKPQKGDILRILLVLAVFLIVVVIVCLIVLKIKEVI
ncbi:MAG TPA: hypothetical protein IAC60_04870 [Candidatus Enterosoma merdigallinarum]|nr:hypothetical protein [Candidatus Enterosoma merdigallinarum]